MGSVILKIGISDAGTPQPDRDLDAETIKLQLDAFNCQGFNWFGLVWMFKKVTKVNIEMFKEFLVKNIPVKLQYNADKLWGVIKFIRQLDLELHWKFKKVV